MSLVVFVEIDAVLELEVTLAAGVEFTEQFHGVLNEFVFRGEYFRAHPALDVRLVHSIILSVPSVNKYIYSVTKVLQNGVANGSWFK